MCPALPLCLPSSPALKAWLRKWRGASRRASSGRLGTGWPATRWLNGRYHGRRACCKRTQGSLAPAKQSLGSSPKGQHTHLHRASPDRPTFTKRRRARVAAAAQAARGRGNFAGHSNLKRPPLARAPLPTEINVGPTWTAYCGASVHVLYNHTLRRVPSRRSGGASAIPRDLQQYYNNKRQHTQSTQRNTVQMRQWPRP